MATTNPTTDGLGKACGEAGGLEGTALCSGGHTAQAAAAAALPSGAGETALPAGGLETTSVPVNKQSWWAGDYLEAGMAFTVAYSGRH